VYPNRLYQHPLDAYPPNDFHVKLTSLLQRPTGDQEASQWAGLLLNFECPPCSIPIAYTRGRFLEEVLMDSIDSRDLGEGILGCM
jgi:hypothetical protein